MGGRSETVFSWVTTVLRSIMFVPHTGDAREFRARFPCILNHKPRLARAQKTPAFFLRAFSVLRITNSRHARAQETLANSLAGVSCVK